MVKIHILFEIIKKSLFQSQSEPGPMDDMMMIDRVMYEFVT